MFKNRQSIKLEAEGELNWVKTFIELGYVVTIGDSSSDSLLLKVNLAVFLWLSKLFFFIFHNNVVRSFPHFWYFMKIMRSNADGWNV